MRGHQQETGDEHSNSRVEVKGDSWQGANYSHAQPRIKYQSTLTNTFLQHNDRSTSNSDCNVSGVGPLKSSKTGSWLVVSTRVVVCTCVWLEHEHCIESQPTNLGRAPSPKAGVVLVGSTLGGGSSEMRAVSGAVLCRVGMAHTTRRGCQEQVCNPPFLRCFFIFEIERYPSSRFKLCAHTSCSFASIMRKPSSHNTCVLHRLPESVILRGLGRYFYVVLRNFVGPRDSDFRPLTIFPYIVCVCGWCC